MGYIEEIRASPRVRIQTVTDNKMEETIYASSNNVR